MPENSQPNSPVAAESIAVGAKPRTLSFQGGSRLVLPSQAKLRIVENSNSGAHVVLEEGELEAILLGQAMVWRFDAGTYRLECDRPSRFDANFDASTQTLTIALQKGSLRIDQGDGGGPTTLTAPASVTLHKRPDDPSAPWMGPPALTGPPAPSAAKPRSTSSSAQSHRTRQPSLETASVNEPSRTWSELADAHHYHAALEAADAAGFSTLCDQLDATDLLELSDVARFARHPSRAKTALEALRRRFGGSSAASVGAFELGRIAMHSGDNDEAIKWLSLYVREQPNGPLAREALGRLIISHRAARHTEQAQQSAQRYLQGFPDGPHADLAERVLRSSR
jgi:hypothetical protein